MSRIFASVALAAIAIAAPAFAADATSFSNLNVESQNLFKPAEAKAALIVPTGEKTITYSGGDLFGTSITSFAGNNTSLKLDVKAPDAASSFAAGEAAKATLIQSK